MFRKPSRLPHLVLCLASGPLLAGCGGSSGGTGDQGPGTGSPGPGTEATVRFFDEVVAARTPSTPSVTLATNDGWLLVGEGGMLGFNRPDDPGGFGAPLKRVQVGHGGVRAMGLAADPSLGLSDGLDAHDLVYVAGGRQGLWAMRVTDAPTPSPDDRAWRIDDSAEGGVGTDAEQSSSRLCNNVDLVELGGTTYLLATFAAKNDNRLRIYPLEEVRAVAGLLGEPTEETGREIRPLLDVRVGQNPSSGRQVQAGVERIALSFAMGLGIDSISADEADVFLAMGYAGVARISLSTDNLTAPLPFDPIPLWGPAFGTGTAQHLANDLLRDLRFHDLDWDGSVIEPPVRVDPPPCLDVAVQNDDRGHRLYVAAEQAGWMSYDITDRTGFGPTMPIEHHQFPDRKTTLGPEDNALCRVVPGSDDPMFALRIAYQRTAVGPKLAVTSSSLPHPFNLAIRSDGRVLDHTAGRFNGVLRDPVLDDVQATFCWTLLYDLDALHGPTPPTTLPVAGAWPYGAEHLDMRLDPANPDVLVIDVAACGPTDNGARAGIVSAFRVRQDLTTGAFQETPREPGDFRGRKCKMTGPSLVHPDIFLTASNDAGLRADGFYQLCDGELRNDYRCFPCENGEDNDRRTGLGQIWNPASQWIPEFPQAEAFSEIVFGQGPEQGQLGHSLRFDYLRVGNPDRSPCEAPASPDLIARWDLKQVRDSLDQEGQRFLWGELDFDYDDSNEAGIDVLFAGISAIGEGIGVINRTALERFLAFRRPEPGATGSDLIQYFSLENVGSVDDPGHLGHLLTHREYYAVHADVPQVDRERFNWKSRLIPWNGAPELFEVPAAGGGTRWILAAPSGSVSFPPDHPVVQDDGELYDFAEGPRSFEEQHPSWAPAPRYASADGHMLVQFFDVTDPKNIARDANGIAIPLLDKEIIGADAGGGAISVEVLQVGPESAPTTYLFFADFGGRVVVYDWDDLDDANEDGNRDKAFARYEVRESVSDHLPGGNVYNVLVDRVTTADEGGPLELFYVYVPVTRVGIEVLRFDPSAPRDERLTPVHLIETTADPHWVELRVDDRGPEPVKTMIVTDLLGGVRVYGYGAERPAGG